MSSSPTDYDIQVLNVPPPSPSSGPPNLEEESDEESEEETGDPGVGDVVVVPAPGVGPATVAVVAATDSTFDFFVGSTPASTFTVDINDLRRESPLFRGSPSITSIGLRREDPAAFRLIYNWFCGHVGEAPLSEEERALFLEAARIAGQLKIKECQSQLLVIIEKAAGMMEDILMDHALRGINWPPRVLGAFILYEMEGFLIRSPNRGGDDDEEDDDDQVDVDAGDGTDNQ